jgi:circadian clock protein KaiC
MKYCSSGIRYLDKILGGGLPKPSLILIAGTAGVGKTTIVLQSLSEAARNGERTVYMPITSKPYEKLMEFLHTYSFFNDDISVHPIDRSTIEKDPLTILLDIGNILASTNPERLAINPLTTMGFGFSPPERRRFFYSFDAMLQDGSVQTLVTGELSREQMHDSVLSHIADGIIFLDRQMIRNRLVRKIEVMKMRGMSKFQNGLMHGYEFKINSKGINLFPKLEPKSGVELMNSDKLSIGVEGLDTMMHGGIPKYSTTLVVGGPGAGKTLIGLQFIIAGLVKGEPGVIVLFEERGDQLIYEASELGWDLKKYINQGLLQIICSDLQDISPDELNLVIKSSIEDVNAKRLFFDSICNLKSLLPDPMELKNHIKVLTDFLKYNGLTVILNNEVSGLFYPERMSEVNISSIVDVIILLYFLDGQNRFDRALSILKMRRSNYDMSVKKYIIGKNGIEVI